MPEFDYRAVNSSGQVVQGRIVGANANDVVARLSQQGLSLQGLTTVGTSVGRSSVSPIVLGSSVAQVVPAQPMVNRPVAQIGGVGSVGPRSGSGLALEPRLTGFFKDYDLWMLLGQMGTILRSGIGAVRMLEELSHRQSLKPKARKAMEEMSRFVTSGGSLSDAMSGFPEIFPDGVVGATRAGEAGGYLPDALSNASAQIQESWKLRRYYLWTGFAVFNTVVLVPFLPVMRRAAEGLGATLNNGQGAEQDFVGVYLEAWKQGMMGPPLVMIFLICALFLFGPYLFGRIWFLPIRHLLSAKLPLVGWRSRLESGRELSFHLERLAIAGISPYRSYQLAAGAVPNKYYRDRLVWAGDGLREDQSYVNVLAGGVLPQDMVDLVRTGELTGTTPQAFDQIQRMVEGEKRILDNVLKFKAIVWVAIFGLGISSIVAALMMRDFYDVMWKAIFEGTGW